MYKLQAYRQTQQSTQTSQAFPPQSLFGIRMRFWIQGTNHSPHLSPQPQHGTATLHSAGRLIQTQCSTHATNHSAHLFLLLPHGTVTSHYAAHSTQTQYSTHATNHSAHLFLLLPHGTVTSHYAAHSTQTQF